MDEKVPSFFRFEDLRVYTKAVDYSKWVVQTLHNADTDGKMSLCRSFFNSAMDISINIAEGSSRSKSQFEHYLKIAKTAPRECVIFTTIATGLGLLTEEERNQSREYLMELTRMIGALIISLQRGSRQSREYGAGSSQLADDGEPESNDVADFDNDLDEI
ncbi:MAG: four helix bundle protein [Bacteroidales bacterium]|nr:four helix bundle protein [Bacteroidales bacterium]